MARTLRYTEAAVADLDAIRRWQNQPGSGPGAIRRLQRLAVCRDSPFAETRRLQRLRAAIRRLKHVPCLYPIGDHPGVREMPAEGGHRVMYILEPDTGRTETAGDVRVLRVFGPGQSRQPL